MWWIWVVLFAVNIMHDYYTGLMKILKFYVTFSLLIITTENCLWFLSSSPWQDLDSIETVWQLTQEWEGLWNTWKVGKFSELVTTEMETTAGHLFKKLNKLSRELKVNYSKDYFEATSNGFSWL